MGESAATWRLVVDRTPRSGPANMALDEVLALAVAQGRAQPTLRLYGWTPPCVSIGRFQSVADLALDALQAAGMDWVRRLTGGRALLHATEVTYAVMLPQEHDIAQRGILESYRLLNVGLVKALQRLALEVDQLQPDRRTGTARSAACMEVTSAYEITVRGRKLIGSAQCRRAGYILQHGSLPLAGQATDLLRFLHLEDQAKDRLHQQLQARTTTLAHVWEATSPDDRCPCWQDVADALVQGFAQGLQVQWLPDTYQPAEMEEAACLIRTRYANDEWTRRQ